MHWVSTTTLLFLTQSLDTRSRVPALRQGPLKTRTAAEEDVSANGRVPGKTPSGLSTQGRCRHRGKLFPQAPATAQTLARTEGILPALESAHAIAYGCRVAKTLPKDSVLLVNLSGRGDKDVLSIQAAMDPGTLEGGTQ